MRKHASVHVLEGDFADLEFLKSQADWLVDLTVTAFVDDISAVSSLPRLRRLALWPTSTGRRHTWSADLSNMPALQDLSVGPAVQVRLTDSSQCTIRRLHVDRITTEFCTTVQALPHVEDLRLDNPQQLPSFIPESVHDLSISGIKHWNSALQFDGVGGLRYLQLENIRGMTDLRAFAAAPPLGRLYIHDCPELRSIDGVSLAPDADHLFVGGVHSARRWVPNGRSRSAHA
ncbi:MAG: hypothetical protein QM582_08260 [Micropruina sp.]|uniref:hypothetical protein n=1 Tax=Micropruina sp. TaxID=2737536 RepID=UPI0039E58904